MTVRDQLMTLPEKYSSRIIEESMRQYKTETALNRACSSPHSAIDNAMCWDETKERGPFWLGLVEWLREGKDINAFPYADQLVPAKTKLELSALCDRSEFPL